MHHDRPACAPGAVAAGLDVATQHLLRQLPQRPRLPPGSLEAAPCHCVCLQPPALSESQHRVDGLQWFHSSTYSEALNNTNRTVELDMRTLVLQPWASSSPLCSGMQCAMMKLMQRSRRNGVFRHPLRWLTRQQLKDFVLWAYSQHLGWSMPHSQVLSETVTNERAALDAIGNPRRDILHQRRIAPQVSRHPSCGAATLQQQRACWIASVHCR